MKSCRMYKILIGLIIFMSVLTGICNQLGIGEVIVFICFQIFCADKKSEKDRKTDADLRLRLYADDSAIYSADADCGNQVCAWRLFSAAGVVMCGIGA